MGHLLGTGWRRVTTQGSKEPCAAQHISPADAASRCCAPRAARLSSGVRSFHGAYLSRRSEVRVHGTVHLRTRLGPGATVPIDCVAVGDLSREFFQITLNQVGDTEQKFRSLCCGFFRPINKRLLCRRDSGFDVARVSFTYKREKPRSGREAVTFLFSPPVTVVNSAALAK
jgi:hypothetical protein